ncbi:MAG: hypothetical protein ABIF40_00485 [archaeon]
MSRRKYDSPNRSRFRETMSNFRNEEESQINNIILQNVCAKNRSDYYCYESRMYFGLGILCSVLSSVTMCQSMDSFDMDDPASGLFYAVFTGLGVLTGLYALVSHKIASDEVLPLGKVY